MEKIQVDILGLSTSPTSGGAFALILKESNGPRRLPIIIGAFEAQSIAIELEGIKPPRPLTHDLVRSIVESLNASIGEIIISELKDGTFYAKLIVDTITGPIEIDSRPSDAIAIAVRFNAPIYVDEIVLEEAGFEPEAEDDVSPTKISKPHVTKEEMLRKLDSELDDAIKNENYERAIQIREEIKKLHQES